MRRVLLFTVLVGGLNADLARAFEAVLTRPGDATKDAAAAWKREGFAAVALMVGDDDSAIALQTATKSVLDSSLDLYIWVEVGRSPALAKEHPEWLASLGSHDDWRTRFPRIRALEKGEVAKAWPWVPIRYQEAFDAHLERLKRLVARLPDGYRGLLLNDLQGGPASCGCGNLQCRWATDYGVPGTGTKLAGHDVAARFIAEVAKLTKGKTVIPVWATECEEEDLPLEKRPQGAWSTGYCGGVPCLNYCRARFGEQWAALQAEAAGPTGLLLLHKEFLRDRKEYHGPAKWLTAAVEFAEKQPAKPVPRDRLWLVVQGYDLPEAEAAEVRRAAVKLGAAAVFVARSRIDQSYEPRIMPAKR